MSFTRGSDKILIAAVYTFFIKNWIECTIQWITHQDIISFINGCMRVFELISWVNDSMTKHSQPYWCSDLIYTIIIWSVKLLSKVDLLYFDCFPRHQCLYLNYKILTHFFCDNLNMCNTEKRHSVVEKIVCEAVSNIHNNCFLWLSASANTDLNVPVWFCQRFNRHRRIVVI